MSTKLGSLDQLKLIALRSKSYTSEQVAELADVVMDILSGLLKSEVVDTLPEYSADVENTVYFLRKNNGEVGDQYEEYLFINGRAEKIGSRDDLSLYATVESVETADDNLISSIVEKQVADEEKYVGTGNLLAFWNAVKGIIDSQARTIAELCSRVAVLETLAKANVSGNPFSVTFDSLSGVKVSGVYNQNEVRVDF